jgi:hypothetical protein
MRPVRKVDDKVDELSGGGFYHLAAYSIASRQPEQCLLFLESFSFMVASFSPLT